MVLYAGVNGFFDTIEVPQVRAAETELLKFMTTRQGNVLASIKEKKQIDDSIKGSLEAALKEFVDTFKSMSAARA